ncbi:MAG: DegV family protein [Candidatus Heimdallarchaeaceae archaeon]
MRIKVVTDAAADLTKELIKEYNITIVPISILFDNEEIKLGIDSTVEEYYQKLESSAQFPTTSQPSMKDFHEAFRTALEDQGYDHVICVTLSRALSSTYNVAYQMAKQFPKEKITLIDAESGSVGQGLLVLAIAKLVKEGTPLLDVKKHIEYFKKNIILVGALYTLKNVYRSGRFKSAILYQLTRLLRLNIVVTIKRPGVVRAQSVGFFSRKLIIFRMLHFLKRRTKRDVTYDLLISHIDNQEGVNELIMKLKKQRKIREIYTQTATPLIGTFTGPKTIIAAVMPIIKKRDSINN